MSPEYLEQLADLADPDQLWRHGLLARFDMPEAQRRQLDTGVALRRYAAHERRLRQLLQERRSLLITPLSENGTAVKEVETPTDHAELRRPHGAPAPRYTVQRNHCTCHPETCACDPWAIYRGRERWGTAYTRERAEQMAADLNAPAPVKGDA